MKSAIYYGPGDIRIEERPKPKARLDGVVLKVKACGVCGFVDLDAWERMDAMSAGRVRGHEWSAVIEEVGVNVTDFAVGDRVYMEPVFKPCYRCEACLQRDYWRCSNPMGAGAVGSSSGFVDGGFAEYMELPFVTKGSVIKLPDTLTFRDLALVEPLGLSVGMASKAKTSDVAVVLGQHLVGLGTTAYLKKMGVSKVITSSVSKKHQKASEEVGADVALDAINDDIVRAVMQETKGKGAQEVFLTDSRPAALLQAIGSVRRTGSVWLTHYNFPIRLGGQLGNVPRYSIGLDWHGPVEPPVSFEPGLLYMRSAWGTLGERIPRFQEAVALMQSGVITAEKYVTHIFPLDKTKEAFDKAMDFNECIEVMVEI
jgi:L-iditol 2-dehydrogenase